MQGLQVLGEVMDALGVQEAAYHVAGLQVCACVQVLGHSGVVLPLGVQVVTPP
eukprot:CAMPEP_0202917466 /NCGR_PEP_ID=MMETSP1392-20130828/71063_1 /ASSEMBLY_ACC=CAM_ASM_000868 /TAXON_ID=225041 /ORGANISM="Chlamydomonas chlamydogama, Strain SAG 11-48b" /LENGTH=52 /DNA_ID=CAMNT_0049610225 /DNA_START=18 /DNA_END=173 /DNA_ORIENTATION=+